MIYCVVRWTTHSGVCYGRDFQDAKIRVFMGMVEQDQRIRC